MWSPGVSTRLYHSSIISLQIYAVGRQCKGANFLVHRRWFDSETYLPKLSQSLKPFISALWADKRGRPRVCGYFMDCMPLSWVLFPNSPEECRATINIRMAVGEKGEAQQGLISYVRLTFLLPWLFPTISMHSLSTRLWYSTCPYPMQTHIYTLITFSRDIMAVKNLMNRYSSGHQQTHWVGWILDTE